MADLSLDEIKKIKKETPIRIGKTIRKVREAKGLTQIELANKIGSDRQYLYKIEAAKVGISITKLAIIAKALEVSLKDLV